MDSEQLYDVIIVGGGPAGCATALSLVRSKPDASFLLVDDADPSKFKIGESLPADTTRILAYLDPDLPETLEADTESGKHVYCTGNASVWNTSDIHETDSIMNPYGMGLHLDRAVFDELLRESVRAISRDQKPGHVLHGSFTAVAKDSNSWLVSVDDVGSGKTIVYRSKWIIDASGRKASVAQKLGAKTVKQDSLLAFYTVFAVSEHSEVDDDHRTLIEATPSGWFYTSQLAHNRRVVVYHTDDKDPSSKIARKIDGFLNLLHTQARFISSIIQDADYDVLNEPGTSYPKCTAAGSSNLEPACDDESRWYAVGDAAMAFDPLSSQGMITALKMGSRLGLELARVLDSDTQAVSEVGRDVKFVGSIRTFGRDDKELDEGVLLTTSALYNKIT
ncbi:hypothetical protein EW026_g6394 [Hermanssonia centrifuga]|uniref:FAD/NAD(P)-binding domain-containing protein n=1 Tax=Hermanssonia centrifuga TaxID=98765 RepID=A0A4S4KB57_9APHY|nr:hypothetical protein EW026_g6394 [Hermanssonia centrifuga]